MTCPHSLRRAAALAVALLTGCSAGLPNPAAVVAMNSETTAAPDFTPPAGLFVCRGPGPTPDKEVNYPFIDGWLVRPDWKQVEPEDGHYDWSYIDGELAAAKRLGKKVTLCVLGGPQTPAWVYQGGAKSFSYTFKTLLNPKEQRAQIPVLWDEAYLRKWTALVREAGRHFAEDPAVVLVHVTGATTNGLEMHLPLSASDRREWQRLGYSPAKAVAAWERIVDAFAEAFPRTPLDIDVHPVLGSDQVARDVMAYGHRRLGKRFGAFGGWLSGKAAGQDRHHAGMHELARRYGRESFLAFQLIGNETRQPQRFAAGGLKTAVEQGMSWGARYFEIWQRDVMNPELRPTLEDLAARLKKGQAPE